MRRQALVAALALIAVGISLGTTVFRGEIAQAAQTVSAEIVGPLDERGNVKVHEQGIADVNVTNRAVLVRGTVEIEETTTELLDTGSSGVFVPPGATVAIGTIDTASVTEVRVAAGLRSTGLCVGGVSLHVEGPAGRGPGGSLLTADLTNGLSTVIDIPGPELSFSLVSAGPGDEFACTADVTVWGRSV